MAESNKPQELTERQKLFCIEYVQNGGNGMQAAIAAGYSENGAGVSANRLLKSAKIRSEIERIAQPKEQERAAKIATAQEVMEYFTRVMNGEEKDQFGLEAPLSERTRAAQELAKRTVDVENRARGQADNRVEIVLDWNMDK